MDRRVFIKFALLSVSMVTALAWGQKPVVQVEGGIEREYGDGSGLGTETRSAS